MRIMKITLKDGSFKEYEGRISQKISAKVWQEWRLLQELMVK